MKVAVKVMSGHNSGWFCYFDQPSITIGRSVDADVQLHPQKDTGCSRGTHARLYEEGDRLWIVAEHETGITIIPDRGSERHVGPNEPFPVTGEITFALGTQGPQIRVSPPAGALPTTDPLSIQRDEPVAHVPRSVLVETRRAPRRIWLVGTFACAASLVVGTVLYRQIASVGTRVTQLEVSKPDFAAGRLAIKASAPDAPADDKALVDALNTSRGSVYLVMFRNQDGGHTEIGTAWAVGDRVLATNAHVAEPVMEALSTRDIEVVARRTEPPLKDVIVTGAVPHPAYAQWKPMFGRALAQSGAFGPEELELLGVADVALLRVDETLDKKLEIADDATLLSLRPGEQLGSIGFPREDIPGTGRLAPPITVIGHVLALTSPFFQSCSPEQATLIHHDIVATGGSSGSPIIRSDGKVVALLNAGAHVPVMKVAREGAKRGRAPIGINYAQRVDLLRELLDGTAVDRQRERDGRWREELERMVIPPQQTVQRLIESQVDGLRENGMVAATAAVRRGEQKTIGLDDAGGEVTLSFDCFADRAYGVAACTSDFSDIDLRVVLAGQTVGEDVKLDHVPCVWFKAPKGGRGEIVLTVTAQNLPGSHAHLEWVEVY